MSGYDFQNVTNLRSIDSAPSRRSDPTPLPVRTITIPANQADAIAALARQAATRTLHQREVEHICRTLSTSRLRHPSNPTPA